jgi:ABC-2 type transport system permease protein
MTTTPTEVRHPRTRRGGGTRTAAQRIRALSLAELRLLLRNKTAVFTVLAMPALLVLLIFTTTGDAVEDQMALGSFISVALIAFALLFVVYYNLVTTYVARREELVLKRLRTSESSAPEILVGAAVPSLLIAVGQTVIAVVAAAALLGLGMPVNPILVLVAFAAGAAIFVMLAAASTAFTRTAEMAQVTTLPVLLVSMLMSGLTFPIDALPDILGNVARVLPLTPVVQLTQLGLEGSIGVAAPVGFAGTFAEAMVPCLVLAVWLFVGGYATRRWFRWEPRA